jgi:hypothetical protein
MIWLLFQSQLVFWDSSLYFRLVLNKDSLYLRIISRVLLNSILKCFGIILSVDLNYALWISPCSFVRQDYEGHLESLCYDYKFQTDLINFHLQPISVQSLWLLWIIKRTNLFIFCRLSPSNKVSCRAHWKTSYTQIFVHITYFVIRCFTILW